MMEEDSPMPFFPQSYTLEGYFHGVCNLDCIHKLWYFQQNDLGHWSYIQTGAHQGPHNVTAQNLCEE